MKIKHYVSCNVSKRREIKNGENYITLDISLKFASMENMKITSSEPKDYLGILGKVLITSLGLKTIGMPNKIQCMTLLMSV